MESKTDLLQSGLFCSKNAGCRAQWPFDLSIILNIAPEDEIKQSLEFYYHLNLNDPLVLLADEEALVLLIVPGK